MNCLRIKVVMVEDTGKRCSDKCGISLTVIKIPDRAEKMGNLLGKQCYLSVQW